MRPESTGKSDPQPPAPAKRGFFAAAGERLKRAMSGARAPAAAATVQEPTHDTEATEAADGADGEATTSVQAKARELLLQDRTHRGGQAPADEAPDVTGARQRRTSPPPLPSQRTAAEANSGKNDRPSTARPKRPVRDSKSEALRARLGAAKAALAEAQAKRAAEAASAACEDSKPEIVEPTQVPAAEAPDGAALAEAPVQAQQPTAAATHSADGAEPIRTLTIARLLARQGYYDRSLSIYEELLSANAEDGELRAEAEKVRAKQSPDQAGETSS